MKIVLVVVFLFFAPVSARPQNDAARRDSAGDSIAARRQSAADLTGEQIARLVEKCGERTTRLSAIIFYNYSFAQADIEYETDKRGRATGEKSKVFEMYPVRGRSPVRVQLSENGVPLGAEKIRRERERAAAELLEAERKSAQTQNGQPLAAAAATTTQTSSKRFSSFGIVLTQRSFGGKTNLPIRPTDFLISHDFYDARRTTLGGRETVLLSFRPRPNFVFDKSSLTFQEGIDEFNRVMTQLGGRIWIDAADQTIARLEAAPARESNFAETVKSDEPNDDVPLGFESNRLPNGVWTPRRSWLNAYGRETVFGKLSVVNHAHGYSDFKLFQTEVKDARTNAPEAQP